MAMATTTMAAISIATALAGTAASVYGQMQAGKAAKAQAAYQSQVLRNNQTVAEWHAQDAIKRGKAEEAKHRIQIEALKGRQQNVLAGNGVEVNTGSALDVVLDTAELGELDALTIQSNAEREAYGFRVQATNFGAEAGLATLAGDNKANAAKIGAMTSVLSGAGSVASKWYGFRKEGVEGF